MDNLKVATEQMKIIDKGLEDELNAGHGDHTVTFNDLIAIAHFYVLFDIADSLRILRGDRGK